MRNPILIALLSALVTAAALLAGPALAQGGAAGPLHVIAVPTADLDLRSQSGRQRLDRRLAAAAREVCGEASDFDPAGKNAVRRCRDTTLAEARTRRDLVLAGARAGAVIAVAASR